MEYEDMEEFDLTPIVAHNAAYDLSLDNTSSPECSPEPELNSLPQVQRRPISKRRGKKRSSRACGSCRARKVRCNIVAHGAPCSNCRHDEVDCFLPLSRRQRAAKERAEQQEAQMRQEQEQNPTSSTAPESSTNERCNPPQVPLSKPLKPLASIQPQLPPPHGMSMNEHVLCEILPAHSASQRNSPILRPTILPGTSSRIKPRWSRRTIEAPLATATLQQASKLPRIFAPLPDHLNDTDILYLTTRSAFVLPSQVLQVALLQSYVEFVYPSMPILDLDEFLGTLKTGKGKKISLLLFQAVILSAVEHVPERILRAENPGIRKAEIVTAMTDRVKLLYDFDTTTDRLTIIQSLLLLSRSLHHQTIRYSLYTHKNSHHYLGLALSLSFSLGLHRNQSATTPALPINSTATQTISAMHLSGIRRRKLERRTWWSLYLQDSLLEASRKGKARLSREDFDLTIISMEDFLIIENYDGTDEEEEREILKEKFYAKKFVEEVRLCYWSSERRALPILQARQVEREAPMPFLTQANWSTQSLGSPERFDILHDQAVPPPSYNENRGHSYALSTSTTTSSPPLDDVSMDQDIEMDCLTPQDECFPSSSGMLTLDPMTTLKYQHYDVGMGGKMEEKGKFDGQVGVEGEYDDYLEFLKA